MLNGVREGSWSRLTSSRHASLSPTDRSIVECWNTSPETDRFHSCKRWCRLSQILSHVLDVLTCMGSACTPLLWC